MIVFCCLKAESASPTGLYNGAFSLVIESIIVTVVALLVVGFFGTTIWRYTCKFFATSIGAAIVAFVGVFAASCVSLYSQQLVVQGSPFVKGKRPANSPSELQH